MAGSLAVHNSGRLVRTEVPSWAGTYLASRSSRRTAAGTIRNFMTQTRRSLSFGFGNQPHAGNGHGPVHGFAHVIDCQSREADGGERFHFNPGLRGDFRRRGNDNAVAG